MHYDFDILKHSGVHKEAYDMSDIYEPPFHLAFAFVLCWQTVWCCCELCWFGKLTSGYLMLFCADASLPPLCDFFMSVVFER